eukprot:CAMPEP_0202960200 /NCGR_PEP_ID=MMETSP1396-20130829/4342_1 /ASSEMBLY_ACC=CAM_ASM_000872 /TAXON_ID= /ORGANISM="Pseudokeronopsis sp., Strain Brazil" /LENGTH=52 /DNA_ID=CAMNT_0049679247 /DNA_START=222 /DNA_END=380 /DNA_ORIENTATION=-
MTKYESAFKSLVKNNPEGSITVSWGTSSSGTTELTVHVKKVGTYRIFANEVA